MTAYAIVKPAARFGESGAGELEAQADAMTAMRILRAFVGDADEALRVPAEIPGPASAPRGHYGAHPVSAAWADVETALVEDVVEGARARASVWLMDGCEVRVERSPAGAYEPAVEIVVTMPGDAGERIDPVLARPDMHGSPPAGTRTARVVDGVTVQVGAYSPHVYDDLYGPDAGARPCDWVAENAHPDFSFETSVRAASPVIRPDGGGFLGVLDRAVRLRRDPRGLAAGWRRHRFNGAARWTYARGARLAGWVELPEETARAGREAIVDYLSSPASLHAGYVSAVELFGPWRQTPPSRLEILFRFLTARVDPGVRSADSFRVGPWWRRVRVRVYRDAGPDGAAGGACAWALLRP